MTRVPEAFTPFKNRKQFVSWTLTEEGKKMPLNPHTGKAARANVSTDWGDWGEAQKLRRNNQIDK